VLGVCALLVALHLGHARLGKLAALLLLGIVLLLVLVHLPGLGHSAGGARRWLKIGPIQFQPSELAKVVFVVWLSRSLARRQDRLGSFSEGMLPHLTVLSVLAVLLLAEPDFGTAAVLCSVAFALLFVAGVRLRHLGLCAAVLLPLGAFLVWHSRYRLDRVLAFLDPWADPRGRGYQAVESLLAFGAGGGFGVGLGASSQKLFFLPAAHNDFILSIIGEELGFAGVATVLALFAVLVWRGLRAAHAASDAEGCYLALGLTFLIATEVLVNAGMALSLLPTKGMALPFLSYGISSVLSSSLAAGALLSVSGGAGGFLQRPVGGRR
jgi:cell division protein FtsW